MRRTIAAFAAAAAVAVVVVVAVALAGRSNSAEDSGPVAVRVGEQEVSVALVEEGLEHLRREYLREGREFPERGTPGFETVRGELVAELAEQAQLEEKARRLDIEIDEDELRERVATAEPAGEGEEEEEEEGRFVEHLVHGQLVYEKLFAHATANVRVSEAEIRALYEKNEEFYGGRSLDEMRPALRRQLLGEKRNAAMTAFLAQLKRELEPETKYAPGFAPAPS